MKQRKIAIITGARRGIGKAVALKLDKKGFVAVLVGRDKQKLKTALGDFSKRAIAIPADVSKEKEVVQMIKKIIKKFGRIDVLVNCAGSHVFKKLEDTSKKDFEETIGNNLASVFYCMRECIKQMKKQPQGGQIINIGSISSKIAFERPSISVYCAAKAGVEALAESVQAEIIKAKGNVKIATIHPDLVLTEATIETKRRNLAALRQFALKPEDIAYLVWMIINQGKNSNITEVTVRSLMI